MTVAESISPPLSPSPEEKNWGVILHLSVLLGVFIPLAGFVAPVVLWILKRPESEYLDEIGKEVVNYLITLGIGFAIATILMTVFIGVFLFPVLVVISLVLTITAAVRTSGGEFYRYPYILRLIK